MDSPVDDARRYRTGSSLGAGGMGEVQLCDDLLLTAFVSVCNAIELAYHRGVLHRDLKPGNIMLGDFGEVYVLDGGIARLVDASELSSAATPPVALSGEIVATVAGSIVGTPGRAFEVLASTVNGVDASPARRAPTGDMPPELDALCMRATALEPRDRVASTPAAGSVAATPAQLPPYAGWGQREGTNSQAIAARRRHRRFAIARRGAPR